MNQIFALGTEVVLVIQEIAGSISGRVKLHSDGDDDNECESITY